MKRLSRICLTLLCCLGATAAYARTWRDVTGKYSIEAEFVGIEGDVVQLKRTDGKVISVPLSKLRVSDRKYAKSQAEAKPAAPAPVEKTAAAIAPQSHTYEANTRRSKPVSVSGGKKTTTELVEVKLHIIGSQAAKATAYGEFQIDEATSNGAALPQVGQFGRPVSKEEQLGYKRIGRGDNLFFGESPPDRCVIPVYFKAGSECKVIDKLSGSVKFKLLEGLDLIRTDDFKTRTIDDPALKKKGFSPKLEVVHVSAGGAVANVIRLTFAKKPETVFARVLDDEGEGEGSRGSYTQGTQYTMQWTFQGETLPPELVLEFTCEELPTVEIPFELENVQVE
jgi:hypothetical protein